MLQFNLIGWMLAKLGCGISHLDTVFCSIEVLNVEYCLLNMLVTVVRMSYIMNLW